MTRRPRRFGDIPTTRNVIAAFAQAAVVLAAAAACAGPAAPPPLPLSHVADLPLGGRATRMDYASLDVARHRLFVAHQGDAAVIVFDTQADRVIARIDSIADVHGVLAVPGLGRVYATATGSNELVAIDEATLKIVARAPTGAYPDGIAYAPDAHKLYVSNENADAETVIDAPSLRRVATVPIGGAAGNTQYDPVSKHVFVNVQTRAQLVEIDPATDRVLARIDLPGAAGNHGLLIDPRRRIAYIACEDDAKLLVLDLASRRVLATFEVGRDPDVLALDPANGWLYVAGEAGIVSVFDASGAAVVKIGEAKLGPNAHVVAVDPASHRVYFPLKDVGGRTALRIMLPRP